MEQFNAIEVKDVIKKFKVYHDKGHMLKEKAINWKRNIYTEKTVLRGISFSVKKGESIGLIGQNGCGKSTTLKLLTKIMYPDSGTIELSGRVSSLLELGAGFHPDLSGRENIYINASIFGLTKKEIDKRIKDIIEFSELEEFIDNPVRTYSSGMYMRLAFSVAINVDADILLIDEILAVGDVNFQAKCFNKLMDIKRLGTTIVLVSHSTSQIEQVCERSIWIQDGKIIMDDAPQKVHEKYLAYMGEQRKGRTATELSQKNKTDQVSKPDKAEGEEERIAVSDDKISDVETMSNPYQGRAGTGEVRFEFVKSFDNNGQEQYVFMLGDDIEFKLHYKVLKYYGAAYFGLSIFRADGTRCYGTNTKIENMDDYDLSEDGEVSIVFHNVQLLPGQYYVDACIATGMDDYADYLSTVNYFEIFSDKKEIGVVTMEHEWR